jgi:hypothetical protein
MGHSRPFSAALKLWAAQHCIQPTALRAGQRLGLAKLCVVQASLRRRVRAAADAGVGPHVATGVQSQAAATLSFHDIRLDGLLHARFPFTEMQLFERPICLNS